MAGSGYDSFLLFGTVSCHLSDVRLAWYGLCLRSRGRALLCCVWGSVGCLLDCVLCRGMVNRSLETIFVLLFCVVVYIVISLAFHGAVFHRLRLSYWLFLSSYFYLI